MLKSYITYFLLLAVASNAEAADTLAYQFNVGEELVYELVGKEDLLQEQEESDRRYETKARWNVYPTRRNKDGSWHLVVRTWVKLLRYDRNKADEGEPGEWKEEPYVRLENTFLGYCDLKPDGSYSDNPTLGHVYFFALLPELLFMPLPLSGLGEEPEPRVASKSGTTYSLEWHSIVDGNARLTGPLVRTLSANYESTNTLDIDFDTTSGRITQIVETNKSERKDHPSHNRTTYRLVDTALHTPEWMADFEAAAESYFSDRNAWWNHKMQASKTRTKDACQKLVEDARSRLVEKLEAIRIPEIRSAYDGLVALHDREMGWDIEAAAEREELYSKPPIDWMTTNLAGEPRNRADYAGRVVILDFWYRGCGHCILALPKVKKLHAKYKERGVVVLGVNNDRDLEDANHVVKVYSVPYESVRNVMASDSASELNSHDAKDDSKRLEQRISSEYSVDSWPTFIVLDQAGRIAEVVDGNAEDLVEHLSHVIDDLLADPPTK